MPEKPEVITVAKKLSLKLIGREITNVKVLWDNIIEGITPDEFCKKLKGEKILKIDTRGKWIVFHLTDFLLLTHLRMEGKFLYRKKEDEIGKHEHVIITLDNDLELRFQDVRKFGKMRIIPKVNPEEYEPFLSLGLEAWDKKLTPDYLMDKYKKKSLPIKSVLLDQSIITGIGNIYADEILFLSRLNPLTPAKTLNEENLKSIIKNTIITLDKAIIEGGTTIRSYTSEEGVSGLFQNSLLVHSKENEECSICKTKIVKIRVGGRGTYYCPECQK